MDWEDVPRDSSRSARRLVYRPVRHRGRGRGAGRSYGRGGKGCRHNGMSKFLNMSSNWRQNSDNQEGQESEDNQFSGTCSGRKIIFHPPQGPSNNSRDEGEVSHVHSGRNRRSLISNKELEKLTTQQPDLVVYELLNGKSGFSLLVQECNFTPNKMDLIIKVLARVTTTQSNRDTMYELLNKTCTKKFVAELMDYILTMKREHPQKGPVFFAELHTVLETFANAMTTVAIKLLLNLIDGCHAALITMVAEGHVEGYLIEKYKALHDFLMESRKRQAEEMQSNAKKRKMTEMDNLEPPDDFREVSILPTYMDIADTNRPFLRKNIVCGHYTDGHHYLDVQFRLLREDFVRPLRVGISLLRSNTKSRIRDVRIYRNVTYIRCNLEHQRLFHEVKLGFRKGMKVENSKKLMYGNLVCLSNDNFSTMVFGSVADRSPEKLKKGIIGIELESNISDFDVSRHFMMVESRAYFMAYKHVLQALKEMPENIPMEAYVVNVNTMIAHPRYLGKEVAYDLRVIKSSTLMKIPKAFTGLIEQRQGEDEEIEDELVNRPPELQQLRAVQLLSPLSDWPLETEFGLDSSQLQALRSALTQELAIIQGPPGTGKTFLGLKIVEVLLHNSQVWKTAENPTPILVVCFTNHALDQFLEGMTAFTNSIVRVGSRTKSETIAQFQIYKLVQNVVSTRTLPQNIYCTKMDVTHELRYLEKQIHECREIDYECSAARGIFHLSVFSDIIPDHILQQLQQTPGEEKIIPWLTDNSLLGLFLQQHSDSTGQHYHHHQQQQQHPPDTMESDTDEDAFKDTEELIEIEERDRKLDDDTEGPVVEWVNQVRFEVITEQLEHTVEILEQSYKEGDMAAFDDSVIVSRLLEDIRNGLDMPFDNQYMEQLQNDPHIDIWYLEPIVKWQLYSYWVANLQRHVNAAQKAFSAQLQKKLKAYNEIRNAEYLHTMRRADIVGMTTTGAALHNSILRDLSPAIVIIEEAAEILESHIIASLTASCQHLIMIGDHQQLQPSTTVYELATKYGLQTSLFERMIKNGLPYETLEYQHRMRPEISRLLVPSIYPSLKDHPSVQDYPRVLGMAHDVFFLTHQKQERTESDDNSSHENQHEAELLMGLCHHLLLQGYQPEDITILTTYSGQFFLLRGLQRQNPECTGVRIAVVDNFQGEENKIILLSLVRSNPEGKVGFLRTDNRVCVALSRAKHGLYITGNMHLLRDSSSLWKKIHEDLSHTGSLGPAFTLRCENHPHKLATIETGADFQIKSPEGGCQQVCGKPLPECEHSCPKVCHMSDSEHKKYKCQVPCPKTLCSLDHKCPKLCHEKCSPCMVILSKLLPCGHTHKIPCHKAPESHDCPTEVTKKIPVCEHMVSMPCYQDPSTFPCPKDCDTRVDCGHKCRMKCHRTRDPDHLNYFCMEACTRIKIGCKQQHPCLKKCFEECEKCVVKVDKELPCGHKERGVECSQPVEIIQCRKVCNKILPCSHKCKNLCYMKCGNCKVAVQKIVSSCGHSITNACCEPATKDYCDGRCPKILPCGHPCQARCKDQCTPQCPELVVTNSTCPKGHALKLPCHLSTKELGETAWSYCTAPCTKKLDCGHFCMGTCGRCLLGRFHIDCSEPCERQLVCGHVCKHPCSATCPPCQKQCQWKCIHSKCRQRCGRPCQSCKEKCVVRCKHKICKKRCGEECEWHCNHSTGNKECGKDCHLKPCTEPCPKKLKCGHECVGFCGDPCPPLCRECDIDELTDFMLLGNEADPDARFVLLEDCGHCIEVNGLEGWLQKEDTEVGMKKCPKCSSAIYNNRRYQNIVLQAYKSVLDVKKKYYRSSNSITMKEIKLTLQDKKIQHYFTSECFKLLRKIGGGEPDKRQKPFHALSIAEKTLCHFQAQVLKKATSIVDSQQTSKFKKLILVTPSKHLPVIRSMVQAVVARVMEKTTTITTQMQREVSCELQRLAVLPAYWTFQEKANVSQNSSMVAIRAKVEALMDPTVIFDEVVDKKVQALFKESESYLGGLGISNEEKLCILQAMGLRQGHWYKCPNGHIYCITECGGAMQESTCSECGSRIGGASHRLRSDNAVATEMDGARHAAWSEHNNLGNFDLDI